jgi:hypothetical protein
MMRSKEFNKIEDSIRREVCRNFGFRQRSHINWKTESGYFFCLFHLSTTDAFLTVKPLYADDLWWNIFNAEDNKKLL